MLKEEFLCIFNNIKRKGSKKLLKFLESSDFFTAPASTKHHSCYSGGLCDHSVKVYERFVLLLMNEYGDKWTNIISPESVAIVSLLHDLCKIDYYVWDNDKYIVKDKFPMGHSEKSIFIINEYMRLTREEALLINWHMGSFDSRFASYDIFSKNKLAFLLHLADYMATNLDESDDS